MKRHIVALLSLLFAASTPALCQKSAVPVKPAIKINLQNRFSLEIDGRAVGGISKVDGLQEALGKAESSEKEARGGAASRRPGKITITKDWSNSSEWVNWRKAVLDGKTDRRSVSIIFHDDAGAEVGRMNFYNTWPSKHMLPSFNAKNSGHASEQLELTYEDVRLK